MSTDGLDIRPEDLATAAAKAGATVTASTPVAIASPPPTAESLLDAAAVALSAAIQGLAAAVDTADTTAAAKQQAALTESPPMLVQQDHQGAQDMTAGAPIIEFPTPGVVPPSPGKVWTT